MNITNERPPLSAPETYPNNSKFILIVSVVVVVSFLDKVAKKVTSKCRVTL